MVKDKGNVENETYSRGTFYQRPYSRNDTVGMVR